MIVLSFKARLKPFAPPYFLIWYLHYYGSADYPFIIFLTVPFRCRPSPITTKRWAVHLYQSGCLNTVLKSSEWRFPLIFQGFSGYSTKIAPPFNHKNGGTLSTHGRGKCGIYNAQKVFGLIILHLRIDVHSCLAVFMPRKILNCLWINASIQKIGNVGMP